MRAALILILSLLGPSKSIVWEQNLEQSVVKAAKQKQELALYFKTTWCKWSDKFDRVTLVDPAVVDAMNKRVAVKIDAGKNRGLVKKYAVTCYPTVLLMDPKGRIRTRIEGYKTPSEMIALLQEP
jgi:thioredoxin-related protein